jgi:hypothetical protein
MRLAVNISIEVDKETGQIIFQDEQEKLLLSQLFDESQIFWGEHGGYFVHTNDDYIPLDRFVL